MTFLFTDIEGSTRLLASVGQQYMALLQTHNEILRAAFAAHGGTEVSTEGDAFFIAFPSAPAAVRAVAETQRALAARAWPGGEEVRVRMGLHTGEGTLGGEDYFGLASTARRASRRRGTAGRCSFPTPPARWSPPTCPRASRCAT